MTIFRLQLLSAFRADAVGDLWRFDVRIPIPPGTIVMAHLLAPGTDGKKGPKFLKFPERSQPLRNRSGCVRGHWHLPFAPVTPPVAGAMRTALPLARPVQALATPPRRNSW